MSFIVKGVDLPKHYEAVEVKVYLPVTDGYTKCTQEVSALFSGEALDNIIQIPEDHGDIKDIKAIFKDLNRYQIEYNADINEVITDAPTILKAEE